LSAQTKKRMPARFLLFGIILLLPLIAPLPRSLALEADSNPLFLPLISSPELPNWMGPEGGSVVSLAADPGNQDIVYAGTVYGGVFKSSDRGMSWEAANQGLGNLFVHSLAVDPQNGNTVYAGTYGEGVYKSPDGGETWFPANHGIAPRSIVYTLAINPVNPQVLYAGTRIQGTTYTGILYRSLDGGASWENTLEFGSDWVYSAAVNPASPNIVLVATHSGGPLISTQSGASGSWERPQPPEFEHDYLVGRWEKGRSVAFDPRGEAQKAHYTAWYSGNVSYSPDNGFSWRNSGGALWGIQVYSHGISIDPDNPDLVYLAGHNYGVDADGTTIPGTVMRSDDAGLSYQPTNLNGRFIYSVAVLGGEGETVIAGTFNEGIFRSEDGGVSWQPSMQGLLNSWVTGMVFQPGAAPGECDIFASTLTGSGMYRSTDRGTTWSAFTPNLGSSRASGLIAHPGSSKILFALTPDAGLFRIDLDSGDGWVPVLYLPQPETAASLEASARFDPFVGEGEIYEAQSDPVKGAAAAVNASAAITSLSFAPSNPSTAYLGTDGGGVYASRDGGQSWAFAGLTGGSVLSIAAGLNDSEQVYAATRETGIVWLSQNGGRDWTQIPLPELGLAAYAAAIWPADPGAAYFGTSNGVYRYDGANWEHTGLAGQLAAQLNFHPEDPSYLFAGTNLGAYRLRNGGRFWSLITPELNGKAISSINFDPADAEHVYIGVENQGVARLHLMK
jgi:photosystem II stability/assembly factor-like uncharacterized protein